MTDTRRTLRIFLHLVAGWLVCLAPAVFADPECTTQNSTTVPLGGNKAGTGEACYKIYVPDYFGGKLTVATTKGTITDLEDPSGDAFTNGDDTGPKKAHGWYLFSVTGEAGAYMVSNTFVQEGEAKDQPWTFWYFPFHTGGSPNLYDGGGALEKYDTKFNTNSDATEEASSHKFTDATKAWWGHCWGAVVASILIKQPNPKAGAAGANLTQQEFEGLYSEKAEGGVKWLSRGYKDVPATKPTAAKTDGKIEKFADNLHESLIAGLRIRKVAMAADLRDQTGADPEARWNQAVFKYSSNYVADAENEKIITIETEIEASADVNPSPNTSTRSEMYTYVLRFKKNGRLHRDSSFQNFVSVAGGRFPPRFLFVITRSNWKSGNNKVSRKKLDTLKQ